MGIRCCGCMKTKENRPLCEHCGWDERRQNESHQLPIGTVLENKYVVGRVLGQGGFGITYIGWDTMLDIPIAIKEYFPTGLVMRESAVSTQVSTYAGASGSRFQESRDRFLREAKALAKFFKLPQIVHIFNFFQANNTAYIIMEYVEGVTLRDYVLKNGVLSQEQTLSLLSPILAGLEKLHNAGIIHRDLSPDNIMLLPEGGAKLLDFGAVRDVSGAVPGTDATKSTTAILKQGYAPIEQYRGKGDMGPWTDVYALCATVIYCLTGRTPPDAPERMMAYMSGEDDGLHFDKIAPGNPRLRKALEHGMAHVAVNRTRSISQLVTEMGIDEMERKEQEEKETAGKGHHTREAAAAEKTVQKTVKAAETATAKQLTEVAAGKKKKPVFLLAILTLLCIGLAAAYLVFNVVIPNRQYNEAVSLMEAGRFEEAITTFESLEGYKDSEEQIEACREGILEIAYQEAVALMESGKYQEAMDAFAKLGDYKDSAARAEACKEAVLGPRKEEALAMMEKGYYPNALSIFQEVHASGLDCSEEIRECELAILRDHQRYGGHRMVTIGEPVGEETEVAYTTEGNIEVHSLTRVDLDNGCVRYTLDCTPPGGYSVSFFNPPNGSIFRFSDDEATMPGRQTIVFDVLAEDIQAVKKAGGGIDFKFKNPFGGITCSIWIRNSY